jgi:hypothetical protein
MAVSAPIRVEFSTGIASVAEAIVAGINRLPPGGGDGVPVRRSTRGAADDGVDLRRQRRVARADFSVRTVAGRAISGFGRLSVVGYLLLGVTVSAFGVVAPGMTDPSDFDVVETTRPPPSPSTQDRPVVQVQQAPSPNPLWAIPIKQLSATRDRPIFSPSRRPPPAAVVGPPAVVAVSPVQKPKEPDRPQLSLLGTIVNGDDGFGIFMDQTTKVPLRLKIGDAHQGWTLRAIKAGLGTLKKGQESVVLAFPKPAADEKGGAERLVAGPAAKPISLPPRLGLTGHPPALNPPPESTSFRAPARSLGNPALRQ